MGGVEDEEEEEHLLRAFEEIQYLIEDLDNANSRLHVLPVHAPSSIHQSIPLSGVGR